MKKDIEWFKGRLRMRKLFKPQTEEEIGYNKAIDEFSEYVDQLDEPEANSQIDKLANFIMGEVEGEPSRNQGAVDTAIRIIKFYQNREVLSKEWIDENEVFIFDLDDDCEFRYVPSLKLRHLLVPKQELPVIPKEVGERIEREINQISLYRSLNYAYNYEGVGEDERMIDRWIVENTEEYAQAWLNGFTVEKHPKLLAKIKGWEQFVDFVGAIYWGTDDDTDRLTFVDRDQALAVTKKDWEQLGISEKNADFINHYE